ncbi:hypothetical protein EK904_009000 [Melospiza melodia maxima]|nr:hypothetical protein EK904_009000 [Melospiza melodia maxima]
MQLKNFAAKTLLFPKIRCNTAASPALDAEFELLLSHLFITSGISEAELETCPVLGLLGADTQLYYEYNLSPRSMGQVDVSASTPCRQELALDARKTPKRAALRTSGLSVLTGTGKPGLMVEWGGVTCDPETTPNTRKRKKIPNPGEGAIQPLPMPRAAGAGRDPVCVQAASLAVLVHTDRSLTPSQLHRA